jgi:hypothetical protein
MRWDWVLSVCQLAAATTVVISLAMEPAARRVAGPTSQPAELPPHAVDTDGIETRVDTVKVGRDWFVHVEYMNVGKETRDGPRWVRSIELRHAEQRLQIDKPGSVTGRNQVAKWMFTQRGHVRLGSLEGHVRRYALGRLEPGEYLIVVTMHPGDDDFQPLVREHRLRVDPAARDVPPDQSH